MSPFCHNSGFHSINFPIWDVNMDGAFNMAKNIPHFPFCPIPLLWDIFKKI